MNDKGSLGAFLRRLLYRVLYREPRRVAEFRRAANRAAAKRWPNA